MTDPSGVEHQFGKRFDDNLLLNIVKLDNRQKVMPKILSNHG